MTKRATDPEKSQNLNTAAKHSRYFHTHIQEFCSRRAVFEARKNKVLLEKDLKEHSIPSFKAAQDFSVKGFSIKILKYPLGLTGERSSGNWHQAFVHDWKLDLELAKKNRKPT